MHPITEPEIRCWIWMLSTTPVAIVGTANVGRGFKTLVCVGPIPHGRAL